MVRPRNKDLKGLFTLRILLLCLGLSIGLCSTAVAKPWQPREIPQSIYLDRSGMPELVAQSATTGLIIAPLLTTSVFDDSVRQGSGFLLGPILGVALPYLLNKDKPLYTSEALTYNFAQRLGLLNGAIIPILWDENDFSVISGVMSLTTLGSLGASIALYPKSELTPGQLSSLSTGLYVGAATGGLSLIAFSDKNLKSSTIAATFLVSVNAGALTAYMLRDHLDINRSRVLMLDFGALGGAILGAGTGFLLGGESSSAEMISIMAIVGMYGGIFTSYKLTDKMDEYKQSAPAEDKSGKVTLNEPSPTLIPGVHPETGQATLNPGLNLLHGTW